LAKLRNIYSYETKKKSTPTMLIVDYKSIQNADTARKKVVIIHPQNGLSNGLLLVRQMQDTLEKP